MELNKTGIKHEVSFWKRFIESERFKYGWLPEIRTPELQDEAYEFLKPFKNKPVLDVGSGVSSILHGTIDQNNLVSCDPLANHYAEIFNYKENRINKPLAYTGEEVGEYLPEMFDVVHMSNAIDHSINPIQVFQSLITCAKIGGYVMIQGFENEAEFENYSGFHQWNISQSLGTIYALQKTGSIQKLEDERIELVEYHVKNFENKTWFINIYKRVK